MTNIVEIERVLVEMARDMEILIDASREVSPLVYRIAMEQIPSVLLLLGQGSRAGEIAALLAKMHAEETGDLTEERLVAKARSYLPPFKESDDEEDH